MIKNILRLLAASTSFVALLLAGNSAIALTPSDLSVDQVSSSMISLNVVSPTLQSIAIGNNKQNPLAHLGCNCAVCTQGVNQSNSGV